MEKLKNYDIPNKLSLALLYLLSMGILGGLIASSVYQLMLTYYPNNPNNQPFTMSLTNLLAYVIMTFFFLYILRNYYYEQFQTFTKRFFYFAVIALAGFIFNIFLTLFINIFLEIVGFTMRESQNQEAIVDTLKYPLIAIPMIIFGAPIVEETIFRGVVFNFFRNRKLPKKLNLILAFFFSSSLFGMIHVFDAFIASGDYTELVLGLTYISAGFVLTLLYYLTNNIFVPMLMHFIQNSFSVLMILLMQIFPTPAPIRPFSIVMELLSLILK